MVSQKAIVLALVLSGSIGVWVSTLGSDSAAPVLAQTRNDRKTEGDRQLQQGKQLAENQQYQAAIQRFETALKIYREVQNRNGQANALMSMGNAHRILSQYDKAIELLQESGSILQEDSDLRGQANVLMSLGNVYVLRSQYKKATDLYEQALSMFQAVKDRSGEASALGNLGNTYRWIAQYEKAISFSRRALPLLRLVKDRNGQANVLMNLGNSYLFLAQYAKAIDFYQQALSIFEETKDRLGKAIVLMNLGATNRRLQKYDKASNFYRQSLNLYRAIGNRDGEASVLLNFGVIYDDLLRYSEAINFYQQSLVIFREIKDLNGKANVLNNLGNSYKSISKYDRAIDFYQQSLVIFRVIEDRNGESKNLENVGHLLVKQNQLEMAIVFYKQSVNVRESIRKDIRQLPKEQQASYTQSVESTYRRLTDLLLKQNRIMEALQVLDLLKVQELQDYLRDDKGNTLAEQKLPFLEPETQLLQQIDSAIATQTLNQQLNSPAIQALVQQLQATAAAQNLTLPTYQSLQTRVQKLGKNIALFYPLILDDRLELVVFLPDRPPIRRTVAVSRKQLEATIQTFSKTLNDSYTWDVKQPAQQLYTWLIQPFAAELQQSNVQTIVYAPDGQMRYVPLAALYDGQQWLTQRFQINYLTALALTPLEPRSTNAPRILAGAYAQGRYKFQVAGENYEFNGLPFARTEVERLAADFPNTTPLFDKAFDRSTILAQKERHSILHFATHAAFVPGTPEDSFIVLGDGSRINLREIGDWKLPNTQLVVLSACQTAIGEKLGNGLEVLGFGYQLQRTGVRASIASLWSVNDAGTQTLMNNFYAILKASNLTETEALQKAQIALMTNQTLIDLKDKRGVVQPLTLNQPTRPDLKSIGYSHPYYWAPFILIGNGL